MPTPIPDELTQEQFLQLIQASSPAPGQPTPQDQLPGEMTEDQFLRMAKVNEAIAKAPAPPPEAEPPGWWGRTIDRIGGAMWRGQEKVTNWAKGEAADAALGRAAKVLTPPSLAGILPVNAPNAAVGQAVRAGAEDIAKSAASGFWDPIADIVRNPEKPLAALIDRGDYPPEITEPLRKLYSLIGLDKQIEEFEKLKKEGGGPPDLSIGYQPKTLAGKVAGVGGGLANFMMELAVLKKAGGLSRLGAVGGEAAAFAGQAGIHGQPMVEKGMEGAAFGMIGGLPAPAVAERLVRMGVPKQVALQIVQGGKLAAESGAIGGLEVARGAEPEEIAIGMMVPVAMRGYRGVRKGASEFLGSAADANEYAQRMAAVKTLSDRRLGAMHPLFTEDGAREWIASSPEARNIAERIAGQEFPSASAFESAGFAGEGWNRVQREHVQQMFRVVLDKQAPPPKGLVDEAEAGVVIGKKKWPSWVEKTLTTIDKAYSDVRGVESKADKAAREAAEAELRDILLEIQRREGTNRVPQDVRREQVAAGMESQPPARPPAGAMGPPDLRPREGPPTDQEMVADLMVRLGRIPTKQEVVDLLGAEHFGGSAREKAGQLIKEVFGDGTRSPDQRVREPVQEAGPAGEAPKPAAAEKAEAPEGAKPSPPAEEAPGVQDFSGLSDLELAMGVFNYGDSQMRHALWERMSNPSVFTQQRHEKLLADVGEMVGEEPRVVDAVLKESVHRDPAGMTDVQLAREVMDTDNLDSKRELLRRIDQKSWKYQRGRDLVRKLAEETGVSEKQLADSLQYRLYGTEPTPPQSEPPAGASTPSTPAGAPPDAVAKRQAFTQARNKLHRVRMEELFPFEEGYADWKAEYEKARAEVAKLRDELREEPVRPAEDELASLRTGKTPIEPWKFREAAAAGKLSEPPPEPAAPAPPEKPAAPKPIRPDRKPVVERVRSPQQQQLRDKAERVAEGLDLQGRNVLLRAFDAAHAQGFTGPKAVEVAWREYAKNRSRLPQSLKDEDTWRKNTTQLEKDLRKSRGRRVLTGAEKALADARKEAYAVVDRYSDLLGMSDADIRDPMAGSEERATGEDYNAIEGATFNNSKEGRSAAKELRRLLPPELQKQVRINPAKSSGPDAQDQFMAVGADKMAEMIKTWHDQNNPERKLERLLEYTGGQTDLMAPEDLYTIERYRRMAASPELAEQLASRRMDKWRQEALQEGDVFQRHAVPMEVRRQEGSVFVREADGGTWEEYPAGTRIVGDRGTLEHRPRTPGAKAAESPGMETPEGIGFIGNPINPIPGFNAGAAMERMLRSLGKLPKAARRLFTSRGDMPKTVFGQNVLRTAEISKAGSHIRYAMRDLNRVVKREYGTSVDRVSLTTLQAMNDVLHGKAPRTPVKPGTLAKMQELRDYIDFLSEELIRVGAVDGKLIPIFKANKGIYVMRSYKVFDDPTWIDRVPQAIVNQAKAEIRLMDPTLTPEQVEGRIRSYLYEGKAAESPLAFLTGTKIGQKDLSILMKRENIPEWLRQLWGEHDDPRVNYVRSVTKMVNLLENHRFLTTVRAAGLNEFLFSKQVINGNGQFITRLSSEGNPSMKPLDGLYTTPEIKAAFESVFSPKNGSKALEAYMRLNGLMKYSGTVLSYTTQMRNLISNVGFAIAQGHYRVGFSYKAARAVLANLGAADTQKYRDYFMDAQKYGVVGESVRGEELRAVMKDAMSRDVDDPMIKGIWAKAGKLVADVYRAEDDVWKLFAWENEIARYKKAYPTWTTEQVKQRAAEIVRDTYPTYSMVPEGIRMIRRSPLIGKFVSFPAEVVRVTKNSVVLAVREMADPAMRWIGVERAVGLLAASTATAGIAAVSRHLYGITLERDRDVREFVPDWSKNSQLVYVGQDENGDWRYVDLSYSDPFAYLRKPVIALLSGRDWQTGLDEAAKAALEPFIEMDFLTERAIQARMNKKESGASVYNEQASRWTKAKASFEHIMEPTIPGTFKSLQRVKAGAEGRVSPSGRKYEMGAEIVAMVAGQRRSTADVRQSLSFDGKDFDRDMAEAERQLTSVMTQRGTVTDQEIAQAYQQTEQARRRIFDAMAEKVHAARRLGLSNEEIAGIIRSSGVTREYSIRLALDKYEPYTPSKQFAQKLYQKGGRDMVMRMKSIPRVAKQP